MIYLDVSLLRSASREDNIMKLSGLVAFTIVLAPLGAQASFNLPNIVARTSASYGSDIADEKFYQFPAPSLPVTVESRSHIPVGGATEYVYGDHVVAWDSADAYAYATVPGTDGAYARVGGRTLFPNAKPRATAQYSRFTNWVATGPTPRTTVDLFTFFDGFLYTSFRTADGEPIKASMEVLVELQSTLGFKTILSGSAKLNAANGIARSFTTSNDWSSDTWTSSFTNKTSEMPLKNGNDQLWVQSYSENIRDIVEVPTGEIFTVKLRVSLIAENFVGTYHNYATADYSHTSDFEIRTSRPGYSVREVNLVVPEPASSMALIVGAIGLFKGRSKRIKAEKR